MWNLFSSGDRAAPAAPERPSLTLFFCLVGAFLLSLLPQLPQLPLWVSAGIAAAMVLRSIGEVRNWPLPSATTTGLLALVLLAAIYRQFDTVFGRSAGTAFMAALLAIKFFELRGPRDIALIIFSSFFVVMSSLLYSQTIELFAYCLIMMWVLTALLLRAGMGDRPENGLLLVLRGAGIIFLQALPLALVLFFFFPRYHGALQLAVDDTSVGLTDRIEPGSISRLADDDSPAMMVKILAGSAPDPSMTYWRALVLWEYRNGAWTPGPPASYVPPQLPAVGEQGDVVRQEITIYPHQHRWLFALDNPVSLAEPENGHGNWSEMIEGDALQLAGSNVLTQRERYQVTSSSQLAPQPGGLNATIQNIAVSLPHFKDDEIDPEVRQLADQLKKDSPDVDAYILAVLHFFRHDGFIYTVAPGPSGPHALANFLLRGKRGFCEHYASAFAVLMRLEGYPTRIVVGYHGAQFNPYNNLYIVKQSDAHAWDEVWIAGENRWRRVDPTSVLSHVEAGLAQDGVDPAGSEGLSIEVAHHRITLVSGSYLPSWVRRGMLEAQLRREELEADWNDWVFSYDPQVQSRLAQALGFHGEARVLLSALSIFAFSICGLVLLLVMGRRERRSPVENLYDRVCRNLAHRGLPRAAWEGPLAYTGRAATAYPEQEVPIRDLGRLVARARYAEHPPVTTRRELRALRKQIEAGS
jgi:transglutaminase-like putative cysteine protease